MALVQLNHAEMLDIYKFHVNRGCFVKVLKYHRLLGLEMVIPITHFIDPPAGWEYYLKRQVCAVCRVLQRGFNVCTEHVRFEIKHDFKH